ncbi:MAG: 3-oxoacyl-ACP reductase FabG [Bacteroidota bacterium]|nr:3-oxoacyl-ACP reductase FabG [Candidatus Kapabacteria bacterium]MDW8218892.1 3-oxoacyl-ACP reductase FabG [Bacteroidota bacterium]
MRRLESKIAVITGGVQGIGLATAQLFAQHGATVVLWDIHVEKGRHIVEECQARGEQVVFKSVDVVNVEEVYVAARDVVQAYGRIDILVNNAGITRDATLLKITSAQWQQVIDVNLTGVFNCAHAIVPYMVEQRYGRIINASSVVGLYGNFGQTNYAAAKAGVIGMTKVWAKELGRKGITVNAIAPGFIATDMLSTIPEKVLDTMREKTPLQRLGTPEDVAHAYLFLASDEASFITGAVLSVDGGVTL